MFANLLGLLCLVTPCASIVGVDISQPVSKADWTCLQTPGGQGPVEFAIARIYTESGRVDTNGVQSIIAAHAAGVPHVDGYLFPCFKCGNAAGQVSAAVSAIKNAGTSIGMLWYDIEGSDWGTQSENQAFLRAMVDEGKKLGISAGVYTNWNSWGSIMGRSYNYAHSQGLPNWYAHYDNDKTFSDYQSFGGWTKPNMKQYIGNARSCNAGVDYNWYPGTLAEMTKARGTATNMTKQSDTTKIAAAPTVLATPTPAQARYQDTDFIALIHFNMGTFAHNGDPCCDPSNWDVLAPYATGKTSDPATFNPVKLNTTQWFESITGLGANIAILTAKHGCGFTLWPTKSTLPDGSPYNYDVGAKHALGRDVLSEFVASANSAGVGYGFYYSLMKSFYLCHSYQGTNSCMDTILPGQKNFTDAEYGAIAKAQVTELWSKYGNLTEIWVDSAFPKSFDAGALMEKLQPQAVGTPVSPTGWCGTESGHPTKDVGGGPIWNMGGGTHGDVASSQYEPKFCDPQLFQEHVWFWEPNLKVRTLAMLIPIYHDIVGRGMTMELAFAIDRDGLVEDTHAVMYKALGNWVRQCYGSPIKSTSGHGTAVNGSTFELVVPGNTTFDRFQLKEETVVGQRVRNYTIESMDSSAGGWETVVTSEAIGRKKIHVLDTAVTTAVGSTTRIRLTIGHAVALPMVTQFAVFAPCPSK